MSIILSLDISSVSTGWSVWNTEDISKPVGYGVLKLKSKTKQHGEKLLQLESEIAALVATHSPDIFSFEDIWKGPSIKTYKILALYHGIAHKASFVHFKTAPLVLMPSHLRRHLTERTGLILTGKKEQDKKDVFDFMKAEYSLVDFKFETHNDITDALAVGLATHYLLEEHGGSVPLAIASTKIVKKKRPKKVKVDKPKTSKRKKKV